MFRKKSTDEGSNFWISYADLMAGLLFVFILLIGAIVSKSIILKSDLHEKEDRLGLLSVSLKEKENALEALSRKLHRNESLLKEKEGALSKKDRTLNENLKVLRLKEDEIAKLTKLLAEANAKNESLSEKLIVIGNLLDETNRTMQDKERRHTQQLHALRMKIAKMNGTIEENNVKIVRLLNALDEKETKYDDLIAKLQAQKAKIKSLTGIRLKVISALKEALGEKIDIDKRSGSLKLASNILFDKGSSTLKEAAKAELKEAFEEYIGALMSNPQIKPHLDKIIIEGHTDSDGGYLYNLELSQKRAFAVLHYLLDLEITKRYDLKSLLVASGRAYLDAIEVDGIEDKEASRRIEIKFRLKNEDAMQEIEKVLDAE